LDEDMPMKRLIFAQALARAAMTFSLAVCAQAQTFSEKTPSGLSQLAELNASDSGGIGSGFGDAIAMSGDTIVVGAPGAGAAYVFVKPASGWANMTQTAELTPSDGGLALDFGLSVGISGNTILVGSYSHNAVYVFTQPQGGWKNMTESAVLSNDNGVATLFGEWVAIDGNTIAVSEPKTFSYRGRVQVFTEPAGGWVSATPTGSIIASRRVQDLFGVAAAINGNTIVVGAQFKKKPTGAAYVFVEPASGWKNMTQTGELSASNIAQSSYFGNAVAIAPATIAVGSATSLTSGTVYTYAEPSGGWKNMLATSEVTVAGAEYGSAVAISDTILAEGADADGVAYVFGP
jgi:hypothetical protein